MFKRLFQLLAVAIVAVIAGIAAVIGVGLVVGSTASINAWLFFVVVFFVPALAAGYGVLQLLDRWNSSNEPAEAAIEKPGTEVDPALFEQTTEEPTVEEPAPDNQFTKEVKKALQATGTQFGPGSFIFSGMLFVGFMYNSSIEEILVLVAVLLIHEGGHALAMKLFGYQDVTILFLPLFGGVTLAKHGVPEASKRAAVTLAGPAPGLILAFFLALMVTPVSSGTPPLTLHFIRTLVILNIFNLAPVSVLDGGKLIETLVGARSNELENITIFVTSLLSIGLGIFLRSGDGGFFGWFFILSGLGNFLSQSLRTKKQVVCAEIQAKYKKTPPSSYNPSEMTLDELGFLADRAQEALAKPSSDPKVIANQIRALLMRSTVVPASWLTVALFFFATLGCAFAGFFALLLTLAPTLRIPFVQQSEAQFYRVPTSRFVT